MSEKVPCPSCKSEKVVFRGYRYNVKSRKQLRLCRGCGRKFTPHDRFFRMRFSPEEIKQALALRRKGYSLAEARLKLEREGIRVSRWTILKWERKYNSR